MSTVQLINELREKITEANKRIRLLETEIQDKVSEIYKLQNEFALNNSYNQSIISKLERTNK
jgi:predicted  nucleic acid-binding Zn-ribbon protein